MQTSDLAYNNDPSLLFTRLVASTTISIINYTAEMLCLYLTNIE